MGLPVGQVRPLLAELTRAHLVSQPVPGRYTCHDLLRAYAIELVHTRDSEAERYAARCRLLDHYLHTAHAAAQLLARERDWIHLAAILPGAETVPLLDASQALRWFAAERAALLAAAGTAAADGFDRHAWQLPWTLHHFMLWQGYLPDLVTAYRSALAPTHRLHDRAAEAEIHLGLGICSNALGRHETATAHLRRALDLFKAVGDAAGRARAEHGFGRTLGYLGRHAEGLRHAHSAADLFRAAGRPVGQARSLNNAAWHLAMLEEHETAAAECRDALVLHRRSGDRWGEAEALDVLAITYRQRGGHRAALGCHRRALSLLRDLGDRFDEASCLTQLGDTQYSWGDTSAATDTWQEAIAILDEFGHPGAHELRTRLGT
jgi:tetratricopeptide (TPR) repeat protein